MLKYFSYITPYNYIALIALFVGLFNLYKRKKSLPYFIGFLFVVNFVEIFLNYYLSKRFDTSERMYSYFSFFCSLYYVLTYYFYFKKKKWAFILKVVILTWTIVSILILAFSQELLELKPYYSGMLFTVILILTYFYHLIYLEKFRSLKSEAIFYLSLGILLFTFTTFPILAFYDKVVMDLSFNDYAMKLMLYGNIFLSLGYLGVVLCAKKY
jgi:hypothetical protein